jgi:hypothetical protein
MESAIYRHGATSNSDLFSKANLESSLPSEAYKSQLADLVNYCILLVPVTCTCDLHDQQHLTTALPGAPPLTVLVNEPTSTVLLQNSYSHAQIVRKNILGMPSRSAVLRSVDSTTRAHPPLTVCGGGSVQITDAVLLPYRV